MIITDELEKREKLRGLLQKLSKNQDVLKDSKDRSDIFKELESIYYIPGDEDNFRHYYSDIFSELSLINEDSTMGNIDILAENMEKVKNGYMVSNKDEDGKLIDISQEIIKLYDHTNLEISRINYTKTITDESRSDFAKSRNMLTKMQQKIEEFENNEDELRKEQNDMQKEYITILGIFASIVLAFTGGMTFSTSVLNNIDKSSIYRLVLITLIIGFVFFNLIWLLLDFIRGINGKIVYKKYIFVVVNAFLILGVIFTCIGYRYNWLFNKEKYQEATKVKIEKQKSMKVEQKK